MKKSLLFLVTALMVATAGNGFAGAFTVSPRKIYLDPARKTISVSVINQEEHEMTFQVSISSWEQDENGRDKSGDTNEIIYFPKIFTVPANSKNVVRIGFRGDPPAIEKAYRFYVLEVPVFDPDNQGVNMAMQLGVPMFVEPVKKVKNNSAIGIDRLGSLGQTTAVVIANSSNRHYMASRIISTGFDENSKELFSHESSGWYVLSGVKSSFALGISYEECMAAKKIKVKVKMDLDASYDMKERQFSLERELSVGDSVCVKPAKAAPAEPVEQNGQ